MHTAPEPGEPSGGGLAGFLPSVHPDWLAAALSPDLTPATIAKLQTSPRLRQRLAALVLGEAYAAGAEWTPDILHGQAPERVARLAGAVWHARSLLRLVSGQDLAIFTERLGADIHRFAIRQVANAVAEDVIEDPEQLAAAVEQDGQACLGAWLERCSPLERRRVLLRMEPGHAANRPNPDYGEAGAPLVDLVVAHLVTRGATP